MIFNEYLEVNKNVGIKKLFSKFFMREREREIIFYIYMKDVFLFL